MKIKKLLCIVLFSLAALSAVSQRLMERSGVATFFSEAPLENITATNEQVLAIVDTKDGRVAVSMLMKGFQFKKKLMQEHFNENYIESDKYPKATFTGEIRNYKPGIFKSSTKIVISGVLTIHGVQQERDLLATVTVEDGKILVSSKFQVRVADHDIEIPTVVVKNIAEVVDVEINIELNSEKDS